VGDRGVRGVYRGGWVLGVDGMVYYCVVVL
jgi:hypothetical protein